MSDPVEIIQTQAVRSTLSRLVASCETRIQMSILSDLCARSRARALEQMQRVEDPYIRRQWQLEAQSFDDIVVSVNHALSVMTDDQPF